MDVPTLRDQPGRLGVDVALPLAVCALPRPGASHVAPALSSTFQQTPRVGVGPAGFEENPP
jgi:hypothetical protein